MGAPDQFLFDAYSNAVSEVVIPVGAGVAVVHLLRSSGNSSGERKRERRSAGFLFTPDVLSVDQFARGACEAEAQRPQTQLILRHRS